MRDNNEPYISDRVDSRDKQAYERDNEQRKKVKNWLPLLLIPFLLLGVGLLVAPKINDTDRNKVASTQQTTNQTSVTGPTQTTTDQRTAGQTNRTTNATPSVTVSNNRNTTNTTTNATNNNTQNGTQVGIGGAPENASNTTMPNSAPDTGRGGL